MATQESVKSKITSLISNINDATGVKSTELTSAVNELLSKYAASLNPPQPSESIMHNAGNSTTQTIIDKLKNLLSEINKSIESNYEQLAPAISKLIEKYQENSGETPDEEELVYIEIVNTVTGIKYTFTVRSDTSEPLTFKQFIGSSQDTSDGRFSIDSNGMVLFDGKEITQTRADGKTYTAYQNDIVSGTYTSTAHIVIKAGSYQFADSIAVPEDIDVYADNMQFTSNGNSYTSMACVGGGSKILFYDSTWVYSVRTGIWEHENYKYIKVTKDANVSIRFGEWFASCLTDRQFTIRNVGTNVYSAFKCASGMTWQQYVRSDYNTEGPFSISSTGYVLCKGEVIHTRYTTSNGSHNLSGAVKSTDPMGDMYYYEGYYIAPGTYRFENIANASMSTALTQDLVFRYTNPNTGAKVSVSSIEFILDGKYYGVFYDGNMVHHTGNVTNTFASGPDTIIVNYEQKVTKQFYEWFNTAAVEKLRFRVTSRSISQEFVTEKVHHNLHPSSAFYKFDCGDTWWNFIYSADNKPPHPCHNMDDSEYVTFDEYDWYVAHAYSSPRSIDFEDYVYAFVWPANYYTVGAQIIFNINLEPLGLDIFGTYIVKGLSFEEELDLYTWHPGIGTLWSPGWRNYDGRDWRFKIDYPSDTVIVLIDNGKKALANVKYALTTSDGTIVTKDYVPTDGEVFDIYVPDASFTINPGVAPISALTYQFRTGDTWANFINSTYDKSNGTFSIEGKNVVFTTTGGTKYHLSYYVSGTTWAYTPQTDKILTTRKYRLSDYNPSVT